MNAKELLDWCKVPAALLAMLAVVALAIDARAQDAAEKKAKETVQQQMAPVQYSIDQTNTKLEKLVEQGRRQEDRELLMICLDNKYQDLSSDERYDKCDEESTERWAAWEEEDRALEEDPE